VSTLPDLTRFFRALLDGRLLPPPLLAEMETMVAVPLVPSPFPCSSAMAWDSWRSRRPLAPCSATRGHPGFLCIVLSTPDGRRQLGLMINTLLAPAPVDQAFLQGSRALGSRLLS
jgi:D-alanyl-D-alanine carboxypeptidase